MAGAKNQEAIFAVGYSTRTLSEFIRLLEAHSIRLLADIRTIPRSRHSPQFNKDAFAKSLRAHKISYVHLKELGGLRKPGPDSKNTGWINASFRGFADYMQTPEFEKGLERLIALGKKKRTAIMCAEGNPFRCHRSLIADALHVRKVDVFHISSAKSARKHEMTRFARVRGKSVTYPPEGRDSG